MTSLSWHDISIDGSQQVLSVFQYSKLFYSIDSHSVLLITILSIDSYSILLIAIIFYWWPFWYIVTYSELFWVRPELDDGNRTGGQGPLPLKRPWLRRLPLPLHLQPGGGLCQFVKCSYPVIWLMLTVWISIKIKQLKR